jgi:hypothetical protein
MFAIIDGLRTIITVVLYGPLEINLDLLVDARDQGESDKEASEFCLNDFARVLHQLLHLVDDPSVCVQLIVL